MMESRGHVTITAPGRLELTLIDLSADSLRVNGSVGVSISTPYFECSVSPASEIVIQASDFEYSAEVAEFLTNLIRHLDCGPVRVVVASTIPPHRGFGSKTATLLAVGRATATLYRREISTPSLAQIARRARTSGIGVNTFDRGGFLIDGGHPSDPSAGKRESFVPTRFSNRTHIPQTIFTHDFPWPILIILPVGIIVEGQLELDHCQAISPYPRSAVHEIAYLTCFQMVTAVVENDYPLFCHAVNGLQRTYLKSHELQWQSEQVRYVQSNALKHGIDAIGLSSNGPALYGFSLSPEVADVWLSELVQDGTILSYWWTSSPKSGASVRYEADSGSVAH